MISEEDKINILVSKKFIIENNIIISPNPHIKNFILYIELFQNHFYRGYFFVAHDLTTDVRLFKLDLQHHPVLQEWIVWSQSKEIIEMSQKLDELKLFQ